MVKFTPDLETKVSQIDTQHKELFKRINDVVAMGMKSVSKEETDKTFKFLGDYINAHFRDEEALQRKSGYPKYDWHRDQHKQFVEAFNKLKLEYNQNGPSAAFTLQLNKSIIDWIVKHIRHVDIELGKFLNEKS
ncbi:MAG: hemerythrin family protein [Defluviitaleaceae bacterium]|nr:hemerythrin family protein [Defluviitaleaceae bacterium]